MIRAELFVILISLAACMFNGCNKKTAEKWEPNYDESKVPEYTLPDPLVFENGRPVKDSADWFNQRRSEILSLFRNEVYGNVPLFPFEIKSELLEMDSNALEGRAIRKQLGLTIQNDLGSIVINLLIYMPKTKGPFPVFTGYNFYGNQTVYPDTAIFITQNWVENNAEFGITNNRAGDQTRGVRNHRWPVNLIVDEGFALITALYSDIDPDFDDGFGNGIHGLADSEDKKPEPGDWGSIAAWAWGLSRIMDYIETDADLDRQKVAIIGHSRLGKTSLWAGANDERFALVISNNSGCGGAAIFRRQFGETVTRINTVFPHWFCDNFIKYNNKEAELPVDQHMLVALIAPRPVYIASATEDLWADPKGEFLAALAADTVYRFLGEPGLAVKTMPQPDQPVQDGYIGYHLRTGKHDLTPLDWEQYLKFANYHFNQVKEKK